MLASRVSRLICVEDSYKGGVGALWLEVVVKGSANQINITKVVRMAASGIQEHLNFWGTFTRPGLWDIEASCSCGTFTALPLLLAIPNFTRGQYSKL